MVANSNKVNWWEVSLLQRQVKLVWRGIFTVQLTPELLSSELCSLLLNGILLGRGVGFCGSAFSAQIMFDIFSVIQPGADKIEIKLIDYWL